MNKEISDEKADKLLEEEMIKEAKMIEDSLLGDRKDDTPIPAEEIDKSYQRFLKRLKAEGMLEENGDGAEAALKTAEIVRFPGSWEEEKAEEISESPEERTEKATEEIIEKTEESIQKRDIDMIVEFSDKLLALEKEEKKPWYRYGVTAGIALLAAVGILAGSMAGQADSAKFVSTIQHIIYNQN